MRRQRIEDLSDADVVRVYDELVAALGHAPPDEAPVTETPSLVLGAVLREVIAEMQRRDLPEAPPTGERP